MNKTVNINLAGIFFHIDEDAYQKLQRYLNAIKNAFTNSQGQSEIIADIESRIAELFTERMKHDKQVIGITQVDEVIAIMGQPEDYIIDEEIFGDEPYHNSRKKYRKLFRDTDNSYIGGVSAGLAHYFGIDAIWIRLLWIFLIFGAGTGVILYILLWILIPEAVTTSDKLMMTGEPVNISNIERKIKDGINTVTETVSGVAKNVSDSVSNVDFKKKGNSLKSGSKSFFNTLSNLFSVLLKIVSKFIAIILIFAGATGLLSLIIGMFTVGISNSLHMPGFDLLEAANTTGIPLWIISTLAFFAIGIPFFFILYLGLKILITNLKSIGNIAKFSLFGLWLLAVVALVVIGIKQATAHAFDATVSQRENLSIIANDTLTISMLGNQNYYTSRSGKLYKNSSFRIIEKNNNQKIIYSSNVNLIIRSTKNTEAFIEVFKIAEGSEYNLAKKRAEKIIYQYQLQDNQLILDAYLITNLENKYRNQAVDIVLYIPEQTTIYLDQNTKSFISFQNNSIVSSNSAGHLIKIKNMQSECLDCEKENYPVKIDINTEDSKLKLNENGLEIEGEDANLKINRNAVKGNTEKVKVNITEDGIEIKTKE